MQIGFLVLVFILGGAVLYWWVKRFVLKSVEIGKKNAENKNSLKDSLGAGAGTNKEGIFLEIVRGSIETQNESNFSTVLFLLLSFLIPP